MTQEAIFGGKTKSCHIFSHICPKELKISTQITIIYYIPKIWYVCVIYLTIYNNKTDFGTQKSYSKKNMSITWFVERPDTPEYSHDN